MDSATLCRKINYTFNQAELLRQALTHRSHSTPHNERLEFLGDSVLNCVIAKHLYDTYPDVPEGDLSRLRSNLVNQQTLATLAQKLNLGELLLMGEGERKSAGFRRPSILADVLEAIFGAVFIDAGFAAAERTFDVVGECVLVNLELRHDAASGELPPPPRQPGVFHLDGNRRQGLDVDFDHGQFDRVSDQQRVTADRQRVTEGRAGERQV